MPLPPASGFHAGIAKRGKRIDCRFQGFRKIVGPGAQHKLEGKQVVGMLVRAVRAWLDMGQEAGVERFVPSEFGFIYDWEQFCPTANAHRTAARQKVFIRKVIELAGLDFTIIPAGLWIEYFMAEPISVMGDGNTKFSWSTGRDVGRIIPHVLAHPASRNAVCPVAATAYCSWNELLEVRERLLGRRVARNYLSNDDWKRVYAAEPEGLIKAILGIGVAATECPEGMSLWANWNAMHLPGFKGTPLEQLFPEYIEPRVLEFQGGLGQ